MPQDGHAQQDCERAAGTRWIRKHAAHVAPHRVTLLGDALYSHQPFCALVWHHRFNFILTCQPDSPAPRAKRLAFWQANAGRTEREGRHWHGRCTDVTWVRYINDGRLRRGDDALPVHWFEIRGVNTKTVEPLYPNSCLTNHRLRDDPPLHSPSPPPPPSGAVGPERLAPTSLPQVCKGCSAPLAGRTPPESLRTRRGCGPWAPLDPVALAQGASPSSPRKPRAIRRGGLNTTPPLGPIARRAAGGFPVGLCS